MHWTSYLRPTPRNRGRSYTPFSNCQPTLPLLSGGLLFFRPTPPQQAQFWSEETHVMYATVATAVPRTWLAVASPHSPIFLRFFLENYSEVRICMRIHSTHTLYEHICTCIRARIWLHQKVYASMAALAPPTWLNKSPLKRGKVGSIFPDERHRRGRDAVSLLSGVLLSAVMFHRYTNWDFYFTYICLLVQNMNLYFKNKLSYIISFRCIIDTCYFF